MRPEGDRGYGMFDFICGADSGFGAKPAPGMVRAFCRTLGVGRACRHGWRHRA